METVKIETPLDAKMLCIKAHEGQFRKEYTLNGQEFLDYGEEVKLNRRYHPTNSVILSDGSRYKLNGSQSIEKPYSTHPIAVAEMMTTDNMKMIAYLHDVVEDCKDYHFNVETKYIHNRRVKTFSILFNQETKYELNGNVGECLQELTKIDKYQSYQEYIQNICEHSTEIRNVCVKVKIADITSNLADNPSEHAKKKYLLAMKTLLDTIS